jgi:hypothetical protein
VSTTILPFKDLLSGTTSPPTCGPRTCSSGNNPNVVWDNANQLFTVSKLPEDVPGTSSSVTLTCSLTSYTAPPADSTFMLNFSVDCLTGNSITIPSLEPITIDQTYLTTSIPAFGDATSGTTSPPTCGVRICTSSHPNVIWSDDDQAF